MVLVGNMMQSQENEPMDDYVEELLESRAFEQDTLEPADDATEL